MINSYPKKWNCKRLKPKYFVWNNKSSRKWGLWWENETVAKKNDDNSKKNGRPPCRPGWPWLPCLPPPPPSSPIVSPTWEQFSKIESKEGCPMTLSCQIPACLVGAGAAILGQLFLFTIPFSKTGFIYCHIFEGHMNCRRSTTHRDKSFHREWYRFPQTLKKELWLMHTFPPIFSPLTVD